MGYYDTGLIDSKDVQRRFPRLFVPLMTRLKRQLFADWKHSWIAVQPGELECLRAMEQIHLVVIENRKVRLSQACDWAKTKHMALDPKLFEDQTKQKAALTDWLVQKNVPLRRGTTEKERDNFDRLEDKSFWSLPEYSVAHGYGTITVETDISKIVQLADVHNERALEKFNTNPSLALCNIFIDIVIEILKKNGNTSPNRIRNMREELEHWASLVNEDIGDVDRDGWTLQDNSSEVYRAIGKKIYQLQGVLNSEDVGMEEKLEDEYSDDEYSDDEEMEDFLDSSYCDDFYEQIDNKVDALLLLQQENEICFVYHPWVTVEEIQRGRTYNPPARRPRDSSAAAQQTAKRRRTKIVELYPNLRF